LSLKEHILQLEKSLLEPSTRSDPAKLGALLAESFFEFGSSGNIWHKRKYTGPGGIGVREMALTDFEMHPLADGVVLATCRVDDRTRKQ